MKLLHIGGVADGEELEVQSNVMASRHSFKRIGDFTSKPLPFHGPPAQVYEEQDVFEQALYEYAGIDPTKVAA